MHNGKKEMTNIRDLTIEELKKYLTLSGEKDYRALQIFEWLHKHMIDDIECASNLGKELKKNIKDNFDTAFPSIKSEYISKIDDTKKYLIRLGDGLLIESVLMKYKYGYTVCVSSEVGCNMGCKFCASTIGGLKRNLSPSEMLSEVYLISKKNGIKISNVVIMGIGEPLKNYDNVIRFIKLLNDPHGQNISMRNVSLSTCGIVENIYKLASENLPITLALSLHATTQEQREKLMPVAKMYDIESVMEAMAYYFEKTNKRITFEYSLIDGINSSSEDAYKLIDLFKKSFKNRHIDFNVNLIAINEIKERSYTAPDRKKIETFMNILKNSGVSVMLRRELGKDISGSCGQLRMSES